MGGAYHDVLVQLAGAGCGGFALVLAALAWSGSRRAADGSVLSARLATRLPGLPSLVASTGAWFAIGERIESRHADAGLLATVAVVVLAAAAVLAIGRWLVRRLAGAVITASRSPFAERPLLWVHHLQPVPMNRRSPLLGRRFARPPPIANVRA